MQLRGFVMDSGFRLLAGARVEVVDGPSAGTVAMVDAAGQFAVNGTFAPGTRFRATMAGHEARTQSWSCSTVGACATPSGGQPWLGFYLSILEPTVNLAGNYTLTITADAACSDLPAIARTRSYRAVVTPQPVGDRSHIPGFDLTLNGAAFIGTLRGFPIGVAGTHVHFWLHGGHDPAIVEDLGGNTYLGFSGNAVVAVATAPVPIITATLEGWIEHVELRSAPAGRWHYLPGDVNSKATCDSSRHRVTLTRVM